MITAKEFPNEVFESKEALFKKLKKNKSLLIAQKKMVTKHSDAIDYSSVLVSKRVDANKSESENASDEQQRNTIKVISVINTTNILDSHCDVHLPNTFKKSVQENKSLLLLDQHRATFESIITDDVKAYLKNYKWKDLGYDADGETQALVFESTISKDRHSYMFEQYKLGRVKNHSVGMRYVNILLAVNSDEKYYTEEKEIYDKYIDQIINKEEAEQLGYFWAVTEAKAIEGSAVVFGSNKITPTIEVKNFPEPRNHSANDGEPLDNTLEEAQKLVELLNF